MPKRQKELENPIVACYPDATGKYVMAAKGYDGDAWLRTDAKNLVDLQEWQ